MPKIVDHEHRRRELAAAVWRVIARGGIEGVSIRDVAAEARWSPGALRHYFTTKDELLVFAARLVVERVTARLAKRLPDGSVRAAVRAILCAVLPLDAERRAEGLVWFAFTNRSLTDPQIVDEHGIVFDGMRGLCHLVTDYLATNGHLAPGLDPARETGRLHALIDGLSLHALLGRIETDTVLAILDAHLAEIILARGEPATPPPHAASPADNAGLPG